MDKLIQKIFTDSEKAELLEYLAERLPNCDRVVVILESRDPETQEGSTFEYIQLGFRQTYEILGFLDWFYQTIQKDNAVEEGES